MVGLLPAKLIVLLLLYADVHTHAGRAEKHVTSIKMLGELKIGL